MSSEKRESTLAELGRARREAGLSIEKARREFQRGASQLAERVARGERVFSSGIEEEAK